jgi:glycosyltransferase involved in cell wall biosynthesis
MPATALLLTEGASTVSLVRNNLLADVQSSEYGKKQVCGMENITITVTLPVYNGLPFLKEAVESVLRQTYEDFRFLIIDDGSTDGSADYLQSLKDSRLRVIVRENRGLGNTLNQLFAESRTEYVARMDADDVSAPHRLETVIGFLQHHRDVVMVGCDQAFLVGSKTLKAAPRSTDPATIRAQLMLKRPGILHPTIVVRRDAWARIGGYRLSRAGEDLDFCLRLCDAGRVTNIPEVLYYYRLHETSLSHLRRREINFGYDYGVTCALARERGEPEPDVEAYRRRWEERPFDARLAAHLSDIGQRLYRLGLFHRLQGRRFVAAALMLGAASAQPRTAIDHVRKAALRLLRQRETKSLLSTPPIIRDAKCE